MIGVNAGSGQRPFHSLPDEGVRWVNIDIQQKWNPDIVGDWNDLSMFGDASVDMVISHHSMEHVGCNEADGFLRESYRILKPGGSLLIFIPDIRALAERWLSGQISDYIYIVNLMGGYMGDESDRHKWHYTGQSLREALRQCAWSKLQPFDWRPIPGADCARDFWILAYEAVK